MEFGSQEHVAHMTRSFPSVARSTGHSAIETCLISSSYFHNILLPNSIFLVTN